MKKNHYLVIPWLTIFAAVSIILMTDFGRNWFNTIAKPGFAPSSSTIEVTWIVIIILQAVSAIIFWNIHKPYGTHPRNWRFWLITFGFLLTGILSIYWPCLFFVYSIYELACIEVMILGLSLLLVTILLWPLSKWAASLLAPVIFASIFAGYLAYQAYLMNQGSFIE